MFLIRDATLTDYDDLRRLSLEHGTINLPETAQDLKKMLKRSTQSFAGLVDPKGGHAQYVFVMEDTRTGHVIGTSKIFARHGTPKKPHVYFQVMHKNVSSKTLKVEFRRKFYRFCADPRGTTEVGGLVLSSKYQHHKEGFGKQLSYIRFIFMKAHQNWFLKKIIAELLPPLHEGQSSLWNFYGQKLTKLPYRKADLLSFKDKEFILKLFPHADLYHDILPKQVQDDMERTGPGSTAAKYLLSQIGFYYANQVDPFDGGPHYIAKRHDIAVYRQTRILEYGGTKRIKATRRRLVMVQAPGHVRAMATASQIQKGQIFLPKEVAENLQVHLGQKVWTYLI